jgi:ABC-type multidrug transport system ATPase subunit
MSRLERVVGRGLSKRYGSTFALRGVDLELRPGLTRIVGANGSGKSTLLGILGLAIRPTTGSLTFEPACSEGAARGRIGWVSHELLAYADLTARQNVALVAEVYGLDADTAWAEAEARFELRSLADRPARTLSRGQRQRLALARALVHHPDLVLLDEPATGLDAQGVDVLRQTLRAELARGVVAVVVEHEPSILGDFAGQSIRLERGRCVAAAL